MRRLQTMLDESCRKVDAASLPRRTGWQFLRGRLVLHFLRRFPAWFDLLPAHTLRLSAVVLPSDDDEQQEPDERAAPAAPAANGEGRAPSDRVPK